MSTVIVASSHDRWATHLAKAGLDHTVVAADLIEKIGLAVSHDGATLWADGERLEALDAPTIWRKPELANSVLDDRHRETLAILHHFAEVNPLSTDLPLQAPKLAHRRHPSLAPWQPAWWLLYNAPPEAWERLSSRSGRYVAKRLTPIRGAPPYTVEVDPARLSRSEPWWIEELIDSDSELTVAMLPRGIGEFYFAADRPTTEVDVRIAWGNNSTKWSRVEPDSDARALVERLKTVVDRDAHYRVDVLRARSDGRLILVDVNRTGEFAWVFDQRSVHEYVRLLRESLG